MSVKRVVDGDTSAWLESWKDWRRFWYSPVAHNFVKTVELLTGTISGRTALKSIARWFGSKKRQDFSDKTEEAYMRRNQLVQESLPADWLLDYQCKDGWVSVGMFLGKEVSDVPFPRLNDLEPYQARARKEKRAQISQAVKRVLSMEDTAK